MFLDELSQSLLEIAEREKLSYKTMAHMCEISPRYMGRIIRKKSCPTMKVFQKICNGFKKTPNQMLKVKNNDEELLYREYLVVTTAIDYEFSKGHSVYAVCPRCEITIEREYQSFCDRCGQRLDWNSYGNAKIIHRNCTNQTIKA